MVSTVDGMLKLNGELSQIELDFGRDGWEGVVRWGEKGYGLRAS